MSENNLALQVRRRCCRRLQPAQADHNGVQCPPRAAEEQFLFKTDCLPDMEGSSNADKVLMSAMCRLQAFHRGGICAFDYVWRSLRESYTTTNNMNHKI